MSDRIFFPLVFVFAAAMILLAIREDPDRLPTGPVGGADTNYERVVIEDVDLNRVMSSLEKEAVLINRDGVNYLQIAARNISSPTEPANSTHFRLAADLETQFSGHVLRVVITARSGGGMATQSFEANYSAGKAGQSGWQVFQLTPDFESYTFETRIPIATGQGVDYLGIRPVSTGEIQIVEIKSIVFERLKRWDTGDGA